MCVPCSSGALQAGDSRAAILDLPEVRRLCGVSSCPDCVPSRELLRRDLDHEDVKAAAIAVLRDSGKGAAYKVLDEADMVATHLLCDCPFTGTTIRIVCDRVLCVPRIARRGFYCQLADCVDLHR